MISCQLLFGSPAECDSLCSKPKTVEFTQEDVNKILSQMGLDPEDGEVKDVFETLGDRVVVDKNMFKKSCAAIIEKLENTRKELDKILDQYKDVPIPPGKVTEEYVVDSFFKFTNKIAEEQNLIPPEIKEDKAKLNELMALLLQDLRNDADTTRKIAYYLLKADDTGVDVHMPKHSLRGVAGATLFVLTNLYQLRLSTLILTTVGMEIKAATTLYLTATAVGGLAGLGILCLGLVTVGALMITAQPSLQTKGLTEYYRLVGGNKSVVSDRKSSSGSSRSDSSTTQLFRQPEPSHQPTIDENRPSTSAESNPLNIPLSEEEIQQIAQMPIERIEEPPSPSGLPGTTPPEGFLGDLATIRFSNTNLFDGDTSHCITPQFFDFLKLLYQ